jgi:hypothetical protein
LESDGSNWVIFNDRFQFAAAAASLLSHIDGTGAEPTLTIGFPRSGPLSAEQKAEYDIYTLFLEVRKKKTAAEMWEAIKDQREKKSRMVTQ